jgi:glyoxylate reductase
MNKPKVLVASRLPGETQNLLARSFELTVNEGEAYTLEELYANARDKDAIISMLVNKIDRTFFDNCPSIKVVANVAVGYDNIDVGEAQKRGVLVCNTPGVLTDSTADLAFALMLSAARKTPSAEQYLRDGHWQRFALDLLLGVDVHHKTLGIIGMGRIGQAFAARARGFSMEIIYSQRNRVTEDIEAELHATYVSLEELLERSDFVSVHCPLNDATRHLINAEKLHQMKKTAILINTSRGAVIDEQALAEALASGIIAGAGLDVFENEPQVNKALLELNNVVLLPHIGSATIETRTAMGRLAVEAVDSAFQAKLPANTVNKDSWEKFLARRSDEIRN